MSIPTVSLRKLHGFTLIELLISVFIIATVVGIVMPNLLGARQRADDSKVKQDMTQMRNALQLYYNDYQSFPSVSVGHIFAGCGTNGQQPCPNTYYCQTLQWAAGGTGCNDASVYMKLFPTEFLPGNVIGGTIKYYFISGDEFRLTTDLTNTSDQAIQTSQTRCPQKGSVPAYTAATYVICEK